MLRAVVTYTERLGAEAAGAADEKLLSLGRQLLNESSVPQKAQTASSNQSLAPLLLGIPYGALPVLDSS